MYRVVKHPFLPTRLSSLPGSETEYTIDEMSKLQIEEVFKIVWELGSGYITSPYTILKQFQARRTKPGLA